MKIQVIVGTTRPSRFGITAAEWFHQLAQKHAPQGVEFELVDLKEINLPLLDEAVSASQHKYANQHTKDWSAKIDQADGYVFVTGEYNHSMPASLKNAIDYLYNEWNHKTLGLVSYGAGEGGTRAAEHLRGIAGQLKMYDIQEFVTIPNYWEQLGEDGFKATERQEADAKALVESLVFWTGVMAEGRKKLNQK